MSHHAKGRYLHPLGAPTRGVGVIAQQENDPFRESRKPAQPAVCPRCRAVFDEGRWQWREVPQDASDHTCPACLRIEQRLPAGYVTLAGPFLKQHRDDIMNLVTATAARAGKEHPLERIMDVEETHDGLLVTTTDVHLAQGIGSALSNAYHGELKIHHQRDQDTVRVAWSR